jgi:hypothetical protein
MNTTQYTIRSVPKKLDSFLRRQARLQGKSLNQTVLDYIKQATKLDMQENDDNFDWIIGADTLDDTALQAIADLKQVDKRKSRI